MTVQGNGDAGTDQSNNNTTFQAATYTLTLYSVGAGGTATKLTSQDYTFADQTTASNSKSSYLTFTLPTPLTLTASTQYAYVVSADGGYYGFAGSAATDNGGTGVVTTGGQAVGIDLGTGAVTNDAYSRNFDIGLSAVVPEPGAWLRLSAVGLVLFLRFGKRQLWKSWAKA